MQDGDLELKMFEQTANARRHLKNLEERSLSIWHTMFDKDDSFLDKGDYE